MTANYVEVLRKFTDDRMYLVLILAVDTHKNTIIVGDPNLGLSKMLREAADEILRKSPTGDPS